MTPRSRRLTSTGLALTFGLLAAACGGSDADPIPESTVVVATDAPVVDSTPVVETKPIETEQTDPTPVATDPPAPPVTASTEPGAGTVSSGGDATWSGGDFVALAEARMDELSSVVGQPATALSLAPTFALPDDFPYPAGTVVGTFHTFERDLRVTDEVAIVEQRIVGVDGANDAATFDAIADRLAADATTRWARSSSQRDQFVNDLFAAAPLDGGTMKDRLVLRATTAPETGQPPLSFEAEFAPSEIPVAGWQAGLPILEGGEVSTLREGRGIVEDAGQSAQDGAVELRLFYPIERYEELEAFFESGVIAAAGFQYEDTPFSNFDIRVDVSNGDWAGTVGIGTVNVNGVDVGHQLIWSLSRTIL